MKKQDLEQLHDKHGPIVRTIFSVLVTPVLLAACLFFVTQFYNDQRDVKNQQNQILITIGQIKANQKHLEDDVKEVKKEVVVLEDRTIEIISKK